MPSLPIDSLSIGGVAQQSLSASVSLFLEAVEKQLCCNAYCTWTETTTR